MRTYARYKGKHFGGSLELGGPIVAFLLVIVMGFYFGKPSPPAFDLTIFVQGQRGASDLVLRNVGQVWLQVGGDRKREMIDEKGQATFHDLSARFRNREAHIWVDADGNSPGIKPDGRFSRIGLSGIFSLRFL